MPERAYRLGVLLGDGIGPEVVPPARWAVDAALAAAGAPAVEWVELPYAGSAIPTHGTAVPPSTLEALAPLDGIVLGPQDGAGYPEPHRSALNPSGALRKHFDLFANIRPAKAIPGVPALIGDLDLVVVRENTEGFYGDRNTFAGTGEFMPTPDVVIAHGIFTRPAIERVARVAFELAEVRRRRVTIVHKANVLQMSMGLFRQVCQEVGREHPDVAVDDFHVDALMVHLLRRGPEFDVLVAENMLGDILSDLTGELSGSLGMAPALNASADRAMAQATHGSAPDIAGQGIANPVALIGSAAMLLAWLGARHDDPVATWAAGAIDDAVGRVLASGLGTPDLGGTATTEELGRAVAAAVRPPA